MGRPRTTPDAIVEQIRSSAPFRTMPQIVKETGQNMNTVFYYLDSAGLKALPGRAGVVKIMRDRLPVLPVKTIIGLLEDHFGRPLDFYTPSLFARDRERLGIAFAILRKFSGMSLEALHTALVVDRGKILRAIAYASQKNLQQINLIESKIVALYATRPR